MATLSKTSISVTAWRIGDHWVPPKIQLFLNNDIIGEVDVSAYSATNYTLTADLDPAAANKLQLRYVNDAPGRDLFVGEVKIGELTIKSTDLGVTYDKGALDGIDVVAGQEGMYWNGALNFDIPANATVTPPAPASMANPVTITVNASGTTTDGQPPRFKLLVDGVLVGEANATASSSTSYNFTADVPGGQSHKIQVQYMNDGPQRDFFLQGIAINGQEIKSTDANVTYDKGALDGRDTAKGQEAMWWNGTMVFDAAADLFPKTVDIVVNAYRTGTHSTAPHFKLMLDGVVIGGADVTSTTGGTYRFSAKINPKDAHRVEVQYDNDAPGRDLFVKGITFDGKEIKSTDANVTYDKGALDGRDVVAGQEGMWWNGTMIFAVPGASDGIPTSPPPPPPPAPGSEDSYALTVTAWRTGTNTRAPHFKLLVDDVVVGEGTVSATSAQDYNFTIHGDPNESHKIQVIYDNDDADRDLHVRGITIDGQEIKSTSKYASYDTGAVDGKYVVAGQEALYWGGALTFGVPEEYFGGPVVVEPPPVGDGEEAVKPVQITVNASGTAYNGVQAHFKLLVDGHVVGEANATANAEAHNFTAAVDPSKAHMIQVQFDNDASGDGQDRNLYVDSIVVNGKSIASTASGVTLDRGELDGQDVVAGQRAVTSNGTLSFDAAASFFTGSAPAAAPSGPAYYVAANGNDSWSGKLAAPNADGTDGPFASLEKAQAAMRTSDIDTTYVRGGTYHRTRTLELTSQDNGVTFKAYPGEEVVLSGGEVVKNFTSEGNGVYSAKLSTATENDLTIGGVRQRLAEKGAWDPNDMTSGWFFADAAAGGASQTSLRYLGSDITAADIAPGTRIQVFDVERLEDAIVEVQSIDTAAKTITFKSSAGFNLNDGSTFRLLDNATHVDQAGEFAWRESDGKLVIKPADPQTFETDGVEVARLGTLLRLNGASGVTVDGFTFTNTKSTGDSLVLTNASGNTISNNNFVNVGTGISLQNNSSNNLVVANDLEHLARHGVELSGNSNANRITANDISHIGEIFKHVAGIMGNGTSNNIISHNNISDSARYGISLKNWNDSNINWNNVVEYNTVTDTMRESADAGGIELLGRSSVDTGTIIRGNRVEDAQGLATSADHKWLVGHKGFGIYLDDLSGGVTVTGNFIKDTSFASVHIHGGDNNLVTGNFAVLEDNQEDFVRIGWQPVHGEKGTPWNNTVTKNLVYGLLPLDDYTELLTANNPVIDNNLVYNSPTYGSGDKTGNPLFVNRLADDYRLQSGSPALSMGIKDLSWGLMGNKVYGHAIQSADTFF